MTSVHLPNSMWLCPLWELYHISHPSILIHVRWLHTLAYRFSYIYPHKHLYTHTCMCTQNYLHVVLERNAQIEEFYLTCRLSNIRLRCFPFVHWDLTFLGFQDSQRYEIQAYFRSKDMTYIYICIYIYIHLFLNTQKQCPAVILSMLWVQDFSNNCSVISSEEVLWKLGTLMNKGTLMKKPRHCSRLNINNIINYQYSTANLSIKMPEPEFPALKVKPSGSYWSLLLQAFGFPVNVPLNQIQNIGPISTLEIDLLDLGPPKIFQEPQDHHQSHHIPSKE